MQELSDISFPFAQQTGVKQILANIVQAVF